MDLSGYTYKPLPNNHVRLLRVKSCSDNHAECEMKVCDLETDQRWYALSYVWGTQQADKRAMIDGKVINIKRNLLAALKAILYQQKQIDVDIWIWIDAICIDQGNLAEKSEQIPLMIEIYRKATCVFVWFGEEQSQFEIAVLVLDCADPSRPFEVYLTPTACSVHDDEMDGQQQRRRHSTYERDLAENLDALQKLNVSWQHIVALAEFMAALSRHPRTEDTGLVKELLQDKQEWLLPPTDPFWESFFALIDNEWFHRIWTFQEIKLSTGAVVLFERKGIPYKVISLYRANLLNRTVFSVFISPYTTKFNELIHRFSLLDETIPEQPIDLVPLLMNLGARQTSEKRDDVYGLLGLLDQSTRTLFNVDYASPVADVFAKAVLLAIREKGDTFSFISMWQRFENTIPTIPGLPSWCPDLSSVKEGFEGTPVLDDINQNCISKYKSYAKTSCQTSSYVLGVAGCRIESVSRSTDQVVYAPIIASTDSFGWEDIGTVLHDWFNVEQQRWIQSFRATFTEAVEIASINPSEPIKFLRLLIRPDFRIDELFQLLDLADPKSIRTGEDIQRVLSFKTNDGSYCFYHRLLSALPGAEQPVYVPDNIWQIRPCL